MWEKECPKNIICTFKIIFWNLSICNQFWNDRPGKFSLEVLYNLELHSISISKESFFIEHEHPPNIEWVLMSSSKFSNLNLALNNRQLKPEFSQYSETHTESTSTSTQHKAHHWEYSPSIPTTWIPYLHIWN